MSPLNTRRSKDDSWTLINDLRLTSQFTSHLSSPSAQYLISPYLPRKLVYAEAANSYPKSRFELPACGWYQDEELYGLVAEKLMRYRDVYTSLAESQVREMVRRAYRKSNAVARKQALSRMDKRGDMTIDLTSSTDFGNSFAEWRERIFNTTEVKGEAHAAKQPKQWPGRTSRMRNSGHLARWAGRLSATTVGRFAGGGVMRPERGDALADIVVSKQIRILVPPGLMEAALKADGEATVETERKQQQERQELRPTPADFEIKRRDPAPIVRYRTVSKARSSRFRTQRAAKSKLQSYRRIHCRKSLLPPSQHYYQVTSASLDLVWSTASSVVSASPQNELESESELEASSECEEKENEDEKAPPSNEDEPQDGLPQRPDQPQPHTGTLDDEPPFIGSTTQLRPPWAFPQSDEEVEIDPDPWPEPDHRYTHLGPGRGKATRHLEAVSQMGFAGGGLRRPRASDVLPPPGVAGGGTVGRVKEVPQGLRKAAEGATKADKGGMVGVLSMEVKGEEMEKEACLDGEGT